MEAEIEKHPTGSEQWSPTSYSALVGSAMTGSTGVSPLCFAGNPQPHSWWEACQQPSEYHLVDLLSSNVSKPPVNLLTPSVFVPSQDGVSRHSPSAMHWLFKPIYLEFYRALSSACVEGFGEEEFHNCLPFTLKLLWTLYISFCKLKGLFTLHMQLSHQFPSVIFSVLFCVLWLYYVLLEMQRPKLHPIHSVWEK